MNITNKCYGFEGNGDLYGIGIRVGVYLSWFATLIANAFVQSRVSDLSDTNTLFILSNLIALIYASSKQTIQSVESFIVMNMFLGYFFSVWSVAGMRFSVKSLLPKPLQTIPAAYNLPDSISPNHSSSSNLSEATSHGADTMNNTNIIDQQPRPTPAMEVLPEQLMEDKQTNSITPTISVEMKTKE
ncbi:hypothetical protein F5884DRAFT_855713 [Xylogone sp. PMI_703]|nr:hypothetical protein F5884DRAFT_855713 [Xylogone sp. PMI_703]